MRGALPLMMSDGSMLLSILFVVALFAMNFFVVAFFVVAFFTAVTAAAGG